MTVKIIPQAGNAFNIELVNHEGDTIGTLECSVFESELSILRRERNFKPFKVYDQTAFELDLMGETHWIKLELE